MSRLSVNPHAHRTRPRLVAARPDLPVPGCLASLTQPAPGAPVGAVIDLALLGARGAGKTQLLYLLIRTLRARAPELEGEEEAQHRALVAAALGGPPPPALAGPAHAIASLPAAALLDELGPGGRAACYWRTGLARSVALSVVAAAAVAGAHSLWRGGVAPMAVVLALALIAAGAAFGWVAARSRWLDLGEIEIALWDPARWPGSGTIRLHAVPPPGADGPGPEPPPGPAELHPVFSQLVRERRRRGAPWRCHAFAPVLVVNPIELGRNPELGDVGRLRRLLPVFAALGGPTPRAMVAISRWSAVEEVCRPDTDRRAVVRLRTAGMGGGGEARVSRETLRAFCLDAEDGRDGDFIVHHLRYDAGWARLAIEDQSENQDENGPGGERPDATPAAGPDGGATIALTWTDPMVGLEGEARRAFFRFVAALLRPPAAMEPVADGGAERVAADGVD